MGRTYRAIPKGNFNYCKAMGIVATGSQNWILSKNAISYISRNNHKGQISDRDVKTLRSIGLIRGSTHHSKKKKGQGFFYGE
tara:strand:+ start:773 stop:1018 length:246 start_codon:yes stop_codon:yes gene_type:complete